MAGVQERQYEEFFGGFFFDEDALRYYHPSSVDEIGTVYQRLWAPWSNAISLQCMLVRKV